MHGVALAWATTAVALATCFALCHHRQRRAYVLDWGPGMHNIQQLLLSLTTECAVLSCGQVFKYSVHGRFGYLTAPCTTSRLQLAALYAASSTLLPEPSSQLTGAATAMQLVRYSWTNEPLSSEQHRHLQDISTLGGFLAPALKLLCHDVAASSSQL